MQNPITKKSQQGFTLIELLIVVAIIGILAAIAIPQYAQYRTSAMNSAANSELKNVQTSLEGYYTTSGNYNYPAIGTSGTKLPLTSISGFDYEPSDEVTIRYKNISGNQTYSVCAYHSGGDTMYGVNNTMSAIASGPCPTGGGGSCNDCNLDMSVAAYN